MSLFFFSWFYFSFIRVRWLCSHNSPSAYPPLLPSDQKSPASSFPGHDNWGGTPPTQPWPHGGNIYDWCVAAPTLFLFLLTATCTMLRQDLIPGLAPTQHNTPARNNTSLPPHSVLPPPHTHSFQHTIFCKIIDPRLCVRLFVKGARSMGLYIPSNSTTILISLSSHSLPGFQNGLGCSLLQHPTSHALLTSPTPCQRELICGACIGTAQVGFSLDAPLDFFFKQSTSRSQ